MRVVVATSAGRFDVDVAPSDTSWDVRQKLHESCKASGQDIPPASEQALVCPAGCYSVLPTLPIIVI